MAENKKCGLGTFVAGAAVGVGLGLLFAPKSGAETRKELKEKMDELLQNIKEIKMDDVKENLQNKIEEIKEDLADLDKEKVLSIARENAEQIKEKLDELVKTAKEKASPVVQKTVDDVKAKTITVLKDVINKLEKEENKKSIKKKDTK